MNTDFSFQRTYAVARKEFLHIIRDPATLFFALFIPVLELFMLGYAIDTNVRYISTVVLDQCQTEESRRLMRMFENSKDFKIVKYVYTEEEMNWMILSGRPRSASRFRRIFRGRRIEASGTNPRAGGRLRVERRRRGAQRQQRPRPCRNR